MSANHPISLCMIVKNEEGHLEKCLLSIKDHVDEIVIVDTGSTDNTPSIAKKYAHKFEEYVACNGPDGKIRDFSMARNRSFELASHDWAVWIDADDVVRHADRIPQLLEKYSTAPSPRLIMFPYEYAHDDQGRVTCVHQRERVFYPRSAFVWKNPVHEIVSPKNPGTFMHRDESIVIDHRRVESGKVFDNTRNLNILKDFYKRHGESDVRQLYYLGLEYGNAGDVGNSIKFHKRYMELSGWDEEKFMACLEVVRHYQSLGDYENALEWSFRSLGIREGWAESYFSLCRIYYFMAQRGGPDEQRNWEKVLITE
jgi:glycosyltransferase involved in cell wall biosynthesis